MKYLTKNCVNKNAVILLRVLPLLCLVAILSFVLLSTPGTSQPGKDQGNAVVLYFPSGDGHFDSRKVTVDTPSGDSGDKSHASRELLMLEIVRCLANPTQAAIRDALTGFPEGAEREDYC